jgi:hypothetical protein
MEEGDVERLEVQRGLGEPERDERGGGGGG